MKQEINLIMILFVILAAVSCNSSNCENKNSIFDKYDINSNEYKKELISEIEKLGAQNLTYKFDSYVEKNGKEFIIVNIQNKHICAKGIIRIDNWNKLEGIKRTEGKGYVGAKLKGLTFKIEEKSNKYELVLTDIKRIID